MSILTQYSEKTRTEAAAATLQGLTKLQASFQAEAQSPETSRQAAQVLRTAANEVEALRADVNKRLSRILQNANESRQLGLF